MLPRKYGEPVLHPEGMSWESQSQLCSGTLCSVHVFEDSPPSAPLPWHPSAAYVPLALSPLHSCWGVRTLPAPCFRVEGDKDSLPAGARSGSPSSQASAVAVGRLSPSAPSPLPAGLAHRQALACCLAPAGAVQREVFSGFLHVGSGRSRSLWWFDCRLFESCGNPSPLGF